MLWAGRVDCRLSNGLRRCCRCYAEKSRPGKSGDDVLQKEVNRLQREVESREQVIGELTVVNRILKKLSGPSQ